VLAGILILAVAGAGYAVISNKGSNQQPVPVAQTGTEPWLGVHLASAPIRGALVSKVVPGSPAAAAGIRPGDVITQLDTQPIEASATFASAISGMQAGERVDIQLQRGAQRFTVHVALASRPLGTP
jgi:serine protease Do